MPAFPDIAKIKYEGPDSRNPLAFRHYNESELVEGKPMRDHLRFSVAYWHTMRGPGADPFGPGTPSDHFPFEASMRRRSPACPASHSSPAPAQRVS